MRLTIVLDDLLIQEALLLGQFKTKRELVDTALREFIATRKRADLRQLKGTSGVTPGYDYKRLRAGKSGD